MAQTRRVVALTQSIGIPGDERTVLSSWRAVADRNEVDEPVLGLPARATTISLLSELRAAKVRWREWERVAPTLMPGQRAGGEP